MFLGTVHQNLAVLAKEHAGIGTARVRAAEQTTAREPVNLRTMQVDHLIPESLMNDPQRLGEVLASLGRPPDFDLNSYAN